MERPRMDVDIACVGFGPAMGGFLSTIAPAIPLDDGRFPQVMCYERADDPAFGVSGVVTRAKGIRATFPDLDPALIPMAVPVGEEAVYYLLDPVGASRRALALRAADVGLRTAGLCDKEAYRLPYIPPFLQKHSGLIFSIGQLNQWVSQQVMQWGSAQIWPGSPVASAVIEGNSVCGIRLADQGTDAEGKPGDCFQPGLEVRAALTVLGEGPVGPVGRQLDAHFGLPPGHEQRDWAVGMKMVVELPEHCSLAPGTVIHTFGFPEPEIFGFLYVHPDSVASVGIFVPSWLENPVRNSYRYLQHYLLHPFLWQHLGGGRMRSWGAKTLNESGRMGEPWLVGDGYARIGEGSGSTNVLAGSGVDEAWATGQQLGKAVLELWAENAPFTRENLERTYVTLRRNSWVEQDARLAEHSRDGFRRGVVHGMLGMALAGFTGGRLYVPGLPEYPMPSVEDFFSSRIPLHEITALRRQAEERGEALHGLIMERLGWPAIPYDGKLLMTQQDALLLGGKVQASPGYADHVRFRNEDICASCGAITCVEMCSGQALSPGKPSPAFDREKCVHCGACVWNCEVRNIEFGAAAGGLHSAEN